MKEKVRNPRNVDIVSLKKRKRRRRQLLKFTVFLLLVLLGILAYVKFDDWFPSLGGNGGRFKSVKSNGISDENFPLSISGGIDYQVSELDGCLAILSDAYLYIYDQGGELYDERQHAYANAMMQTSDKNVLIYESGGSHFRVDSRRKNLYTKRMDNTIIFARISDSGNVAVISNADTFACKLTVFDESGNEIYSRNCVERIIDVDFTSGGSGCVLATSYSSGGKLASKLISVSFDSEKDKWTSEEFGSLCLKVHCEDEGIFVIGQDRCAHYSSSGKKDMTYEYPSTLVDWDFSDKGTALLFENVTKRCSSFTTIARDKKTPNQKDFDTSGVKCIRLAGDNVLVMNKEGIKKYGFKGSDELSVNSETIYDKFCIIDDYIFLLGYDRIDRIEYTK